MSERKLYISILIGFFILSGIGVYFGNPDGVKWTSWITEKRRWVLLLANLLFLILAFRQAYIWNISVGKGEVYLKRFLGSKKITLREKDLISFIVEMDKDPWWMKNPRTTMILKLQTTKGKVTFNSSDYNSFDNEISKLFSHNGEMHTRYLRQISKLKSKAGV